MAEGEPPTQEDERVSGMALRKGVKHARSYDARTSEEAAEMLRNKPEHEDDDAISKEDLFPVFGVVEGIKKDTHAVTNHRIGPKTTTGRNEILPFPREKIKRLAKGIANKVVLDNRALFGVKGDNSDGTEYSLKYLPEIIEEELFELSSFYKDDLDMWGFGIESLPSNITLPEEQQRGVERRREFMAEVGRKCIKILFENDRFRQFAEEEQAYIEFIYSLYDTPSITVWLCKPENEEDRKNMISIEDHFNDTIEFEFDGEEKEDQAATPA